MSLTAGVADVGRKIDWRALFSVALVGVLGLTVLWPVGGRVPQVRTRTGIGEHEALPALPLSAWGVVSGALGRSDRSYRVVGSGAVNPAQRLRFRFGASGGVRVLSGHGSVGLGVAGFGRLGALVRPWGAGQVAAANRISYRMGGLSEWFVNGPLGLEQGFTVARRPAGSGPLAVGVSVSANASARVAGGGVLLSAHGLRLRYSGLRVVDARGRTLRAWFSVQNGRVLLAADDRGARYPVRVDPFVQQGSKLVGDCTSSCSGPRGTGESGQGEFGFSVALSKQGDTALIGAPSDNSGAGAAWVFVRSGSAWSQQGGRLVGDCSSVCSGPNGSGEAGQGGFGNSVALSADGNTALIGAPSDNSNVGAAWVFVRSGSAWSQQGLKLVGDCSSSCSGPSGTGEVGQGAFGNSVALSADGSTALVGGHEDNNGQGAAWVFVRSASVWSQQGSKLVGDCTSSCGGPMGTGEVGVGFVGFSVALSANGNTALIGAWDDNGGAGAAWVFVRAASTWSQQGSKLAGYCANGCGGPNGSGESGQGELGWSVALSADGGTALIGAPSDNNREGAAWAFVRSGSTWSQQGSKLIGDCTASCGGPRGTGEKGAGVFGAGVALSSDGSTALVGAPFDNNSGQADSGAGAAWVFVRTGSRWSQLGSKLIGDCTATCGGPKGTGESGQGEFGFSVALSAHGTALVGAPTDNGSKGAAWMFFTPGPTISRLSPNRGSVSGGTVITITGRNLFGAYAVHFGRALAKIDRIVSAGEVKVTSPKGSGTVNVTLTTPGGTSARTSADHYTYVPRPTVTRILPNTGPSSGGTVVTITGTNLAGATAVHFGRALAKIDKIVSGGKIKVTSPKGSGTVNVTVTTSGGTSAKTTADLYTY